MKLCGSNSISLLFLTETLLNTDIVNSEVCLGSSFNIIARLDRDRRQHGGLLIAQSSNSAVKVFDITISDFDFAISCAVLCKKLSFFVLIYNPPISSNYSVDISNLLACIQSYYTKFDLFLVQFVYGCDYDVYILGDFNFPGIDWANYWSSSYHECRFLGKVIEKDLTQFVAGRSHKSNSILDLVLSDVANLSVTLAKQLFKDHFPICFYLNCPEAPLSFRNVYSNSSFNALLFNSNLQPLFTVMSHDNSNNSSFPDAWYSLISDAFTIAIKLKRAVRLESPLLYSSHTIHLINQRETIFKQLGSDPSFLLALKLRELNLLISDSIELDKEDKELFINQFDLSSTRQCYKLLRSFGFN